MSDGFKVSYVIRAATKNVHNVTAQHLVTYILGTYHEKQ